ncbi:YrvL family regulatory protein [Peribacillus alkalitolerans]|uniref:YrvL family regulatory protein n=1 Tax=Peribacillus alkalitolerans TaxID=1550385 RepID=UPI0013D83E54|nr:YrvL family regulatory protein [Peribacillus alkalitolerans]
MKLKNHKNSFRDLNLFEKMLVITASTLLVVLSITLVIGIFFFGIVGFFRLFGVEYTSPYSILGFVLFFFVFGLVLDLFANVLIKLSSQYISDKFKLFITRLLIDCTFNWLAFHTIDELMKSITIPLTIEIVTILLLFFIEVAFDDKEKNKK